MEHHNIILYRGVKLGVPNCIIITRGTSQHNIVPRGLTGVPNCIVPRGVNLFDSRHQKLPFGGLSIINKLLYLLLILSLVLFWGARAGNAGALLGRLEHLAPGGGGLGEARRPPHPPLGGGGVALVHVPHAAVVLHVVYIYVNIIENIENLGIVVDKRLKKLYKVIMK